MGEEAGLGRGRGDTTQPWTHGGREIFPPAPRPPPPRGRAAAWAAGVWSRWGWLRGRRPPPAAQCRDPPTTAPRLQDQTCTWFPHTRGAQMSPLTGRRCHFASFWWEGALPSSGLQGGRTAADQVPGAPHRGPRDACAAGWATAEGTILPHSLCKVTLEAGTQPPAAHGGRSPLPERGSLDRSDCPLQGLPSLHYGNGTSHP